MDEDMRVADMIWSRDALGLRYGITLAGGPLHSAKFSVQPRVGWKVVAEWFVTSVTQYTRVDV